MIKTYRDLIVWQKSMDLAVQAYRAARDFPNVERFGLISQIQRAASAIPANIAEGHDRETRGDFRRSVSIARGSLAELETHCELAARLNYLSRDRLARMEVLMKEVGRMLSGLLTRLKNGEARKLR